jgi:pimeloyl-ACP methyl ester carboxylesterase
MAEPNAGIVIGLLADVSFSMRESFGESGKGAVNRLQAFSDALEDMVKRGAERLRDQPDGQHGRGAALFAYGFGFGNPLSALFGRSGPSVRDLLDLKESSGTTVPLPELARRWPDYQANVRSMAVEMFGETPMAAALAIGGDRLIKESRAAKALPILFILSDGKPSDASNERIATLAAEMRQDGVTVVSCYMTGADITDPKRLYGEHMPDWPEPAKLMFDCASVLDPSSAFDAQLMEYGWQIDPGAKLFAQVNQSEMLNQFLGLVLSPLTQAGVAHRAEAADPPSSVDKAYQAVLPTAPAIKRHIAKRTVIFIHGLGGEREGTWGQFPSLLMEHQEISELWQVGYYSFPTSPWRLPFSSRPAKVQLLANGLETQIRIGELKGAVLVCHSLGGIIARLYLLNEVKYQSTSRLRTEGLALFAVPNNGAGLAEAARYVGWRNNHLAQLCKDADILQMLNEDWERLNVRERIRVRYVIGTQDRVVSPQSAKEYWGNKDVDTITAKGHIDIVKPTDKDDLAVLIVKKLLLDVASVSNSS